MPRDGSAAAAEGHAVSAADGAPLRAIQRKGAARHAPRSAMAKMRKHALRVPLSTRRAAEQAYKTPRQRPACFHFILRFSPIFLRHFSSIHFRLMRGAAACGAPCEKRCAQDAMRNAQQVRKALTRRQRGKMACSVAAGARRNMARRASQQRQENSTTAFIRPLFLIFAILSPCSRYALLCALYAALLLRRCAVTRLSPAAMRFL